MAVIPPAAEKYSFLGIGEATASALIAVLAANPSTAFLASGLAAKIIFFIATRIFSGLASMGLVMLNVGAEKIITAVDKIDFDGSYESADAFIKAIRDTGRDLTPEEIKAIDTPVIDAFRKFGKLARKSAV